MAVTLRSFAKALSERLTVVPVPKKSGLLEQLIFAILLENTPADVAQYHYAHLVEGDFVDLNELRIAPRKEIIERLTDGSMYVEDEVYQHPFPEQAAERVTQSLQWIFDKNDGFVIDSARLASAEEARAFLSENPYATNFVVEYVLHFELGFGPIPFDEGARRALRMLKLISYDSDENEKVRGISELSRQKSDAEFVFWHLHEFGVKMGAGYERLPDSEALEFLSTLSKDALEQSYISSYPCDFDQDPREITKALREATRETLRSEKGIRPIDDDDDSDGRDGTEEGGFSTGFPGEDENLETEGEFLSDTNPGQWEVPREDVDSFNDFRLVKGQAAAEEPDDWKRGASESQNGEKNRSSEAKPRKAKNPKGSTPIKESIKESKEEPKKESKKESKKEPKKELKEKKSDKLPGSSADGDMLTEESPRKLKSASAKSSSKSASNGKSASKSASGDKESTKVGGSATGSAGGSTSAKKSKPKVTKVEQGVEQVEQPPVAPSVKKQKPAKREGSTAKTASAAKTASVTKTAPATKTASAAKTATVAKTAGGKAKSSTAGKEKPSAEVSNRKKAGKGKTKK